MATHSNILAWRIPWTEEPGGLQSIGSQTVGHNWVTYTYLLTYLQDAILNVSPVCLVHLMLFTIWWGGYDDQVSSRGQICIQAIWLQMGCHSTVLPNQDRVQCWVMSLWPWCWENNMGIGLLSCIHSYGPTNPTAHSEGHAFQKAGPQS